jgi:Spy/CpxP family protein refolding chaperone
MLRPLLLLLALSGLLPAQMPKNLYPWWNNKVVVRQLNLSASQVGQIRDAVAQYRAHLMSVRGRVLEAEGNLEEQFNRNPVDQDKTRQAIEQLISARSDLTRTLSELSLKLRVLLSAEQWQQLQRLRPTKDASEPETPAR